MKRREFLIGAAVATAAATVGMESAAAAESTKAHQIIDGKPLFDMVAYDHSIDRNFHRHFGKGYRSWCGLAQTLMTTSGSLVVLSDIDGKIGLFHRVVASLERRQSAHTPTVDLVRDQSERFDIKQIAVDPFGNSRDLVELYDAGYPVVQMNTSPRNLSAAVVDLSRKISDGNVIIHGDPWMRERFASTLANINAKGLVVPSRSKDYNRPVNSVYAAVMANALRLYDSTI